MSERDQSARILANKHYEVEDGMRAIYRLQSEDERTSNGDAPIKLLEVNEDTIASGIMPLGFAPIPELGIRHSSIIVEITPEEFDELQEGSSRLQLPAGWKLGKLIPRETAAAAC